MEQATFTCAEILTMSCSPQVYDCVLDEVVHNVSVHHDATCFAARLFLKVLVANLGLLLACIAEPETCTHHAARGQTGAATLHKHFSVEYTGNVRTC